MLIVKDLSVCEELDRAAMDAVVGGNAKFAKYVRIANEILVAGICGALTADICKDTLP